MIASRMALLAGSCSTAALQMSCCIGTCGILSTVEHGPLPTELHRVSILFFSSSAFLHPIRIPFVYADFDPSVKYKDSMAGLMAGLFTLTDPPVVLQPKTPIMPPALPNSSPTSPLMRTTNVGSEQHGD